MSYYHITEKSSNRKTGPIAVVTSSYDTCSDTCPFKKNGCYGNGGPLKLHWDKVSRGENRALTFRQLIKRLPEVAEKSKKRGLCKVRLWQVGDMPGIGNKINHGEVKVLISALQSFQEVFGYTHKPMTEHNQKIIKLCNDNGVTINLSANNLTHADYLLELGVGPVSVTLPSDTPVKGLTTPHGRRVIICPAVTGSITCAKCGGKGGPLCWRANREYIIGFPAHGVSIKKVSEVARENRVEY